MTDRAARRSATRLAIAGCVGLLLVIGYERWLDAPSPVPDVSYRVYLGVWKDIATQTRAEVSRRRKPSTTAVRSAWKRVSLSDYDWDQLVARYGLPTEILNEYGGMEGPYVDVIDHVVQEQRKRGVHSPGAALHR